METLEQIDRYLDRVLLADEALELEKNLQANHELRDLLDQVLIARDVVRASGLRAQVRSLHTQLLRELQLDQQASKTEGNTTWVRPLLFNWGRSLQWTARVAASGLLLLAGYGSYQYATTTIDTYYSAKFVDYKLPATRGTSETNSTLDKLFWEGNYAAITQQSRGLETQTPRGHFLTGMAHLYQHQYYQATSHFLTIRRTNKQMETALFEQETDYYLALAYLGEGRIDEAYPLFEKIRNTPRHLYHRNITDVDLWKLSLLRWKTN